MERPVLCHLPDLGKWVNLDQVTWIDVHKPPLPDDSWTGVRRTEDLMRENESAISGAVLHFSSGESLTIYDEKDIKALASALGQHSL